MLNDAVDIKQES